MRILTVLYLAAVAVLCFANFGSLSEMPRSFLGIPTDKLVHFAMFLPFPALAFFSFDFKRMGVLKTLIYLALLFGIGCFLAWGTEFIQSKLPYRSMDPDDFSADRIGLACGALIAFFIQLFSRKRTNA